MPTPTVEERIAALEATMQHVATRTDLAKLRAKMHSLSSRIVAAIAAVGGIIVAVIRLWS